MLAGLRGYMWSQRWNILLTTQAIFTCGIVYNRYCENQSSLSAHLQQKQQQRGQMNELELINTQTLGKGHASTQEVQ